jgi:hypothetical protein
MRQHKISRPGYRTSQQTKPQRRGLGESIVRDSARRRQWGRGSAEQDQWKGRKDGYRYRSKWRKTESSSTGRVGNGDSCLLQEDSRSFATPEARRRRVVKWTGEAPLSHPGHWRVGDDCTVRLTVQESLPRWTEAEVAASSWRSGRSKIRAGRRGLKGDNRLINNWFWPSPTRIIGSFYEVMTGCRKCLTLLLLSLIDCF